MKITDIEILPAEGGFCNWIFVRIHTDAGITGLGEATNYPASSVVIGALEALQKKLIGKDPFAIDRLWHDAFRFFNFLGHGAAVLSAVSAVDIALWDIKGKACGLPIFELLGGAYRKKILLYANFWFTEAGRVFSNDYPAKAVEAVADGFTGLKCDPFRTGIDFGADPAALDLTAKEEEEGMACMMEIRKRVGPEIALAVDTHARYNAVTTVRLAKRLEPVNLMWYEEPVPPENNAVLRAIRPQLPVPVCLGERLYTRYDFRQILEEHLADIIMPDIVRTGGITEMHKIAAMADTYYVPMAPHNAAGPICTLASAHVMASIPNFFRLEFFINDAPWRDTVIKPALEVKNGHLALSDAPGLGVELDDAVLQAHPPLTEHPDRIYNI